MFQASPDFNHKLAPNPVSSHSGDAPPQPNPSAIPTACLRSSSKQDSTAPTSFPARSKRIRITSTRSPFDRSLQAIRDASTTFGDRTKDRGALSTATGKKNVADSTFLKNGVQTSNSTKAAIPHILKRARPAGPRPLVNYPPTIVSQTVTHSSETLRPMIPHRCPTEYQVFRPMSRMTMKMFAPVLLPSLITAIYCDAH